MCSCSTESKQDASCTDKGMQKNWKGLVITIWGNDKILCREWFGQETIREINYISSPGLRQEKHSRQQAYCHFQQPLVDGPLECLRERCFVSVLSSCQVWKTLSSSQSFSFSVSTALMPYTQTHHCCQSQLWHPVLQSTSPVRRLQSNSIRNNHKENLK